MAGKSVHLYIGDRLVLVFTYKKGLCGLFACLQITVRPHEPRPPRQNFKTNFEISQSQVEI